MSALFTEGDNITHSEMIMKHKLIIIYEELKEMKIMLINSKKLGSIIIHKKCGRKKKCFI